MKENLSEKYYSWDSANWPDGTFVVKTVASPDGKRLKISFHAADRISTIQGAEYSIDGGEWKAALPVGRISDSRSLDYQFDTAEVTAGEHTVVVRSTDRFQNEAVAKTVVSTLQNSAR